MIGHDDCEGEILDSALHFQDVVIITSGHLLLVASAKAIGVERLMI